MKNGRPVPVLLDLVVQFHIFSNLTGAKSKAGKDTLDDAALPGPFSAQHP
jgi:hypothetical protein